MPRSEFMQEKVTDISRGKDIWGGNGSKKQEGVVLKDKGCKKGKS